VEQHCAETEFDTTCLKSTVPRMEQKIMSREENNEENPSSCDENGYSDLLPMYGISNYLLQQYSNILIPMIN